MPYDLSQLQEVAEKSRAIKSKRYKLAVFGQTKSGRSTLLRNLTKMRGLFLSGVEKESSGFCEFKECKSDKPFIFTETSLDGQASIH